METKEKEIWREVPGYEGCYEASDRGNLRSLDRTVITSRGERFYKGRILDGNVHKTTGYRQFSLNISGKLRVFTASQLVAMAFMGHSVNGHTLVVDHINGDKLDNRLSNLRIVSHRENSTTCFRKDNEILTSKYVGVSWSKTNSKWVSQIVYEGEVVYLGYFDDELEASEAYKKALVRIEDGAFDPDEYKPKWSSSYKGVSWFKRDKKWRSQIYVNGKQKHLGYFNTEIEASEAYQKFKKDNNIDK